LLRRGIGLSSQQLLSLPGRTTGLRRTTPVAVITIDGERYIVAGYQTSDWVKNARSAGWALIGRGTTHERVTLTEISPVVLTKHEVGRGCTTVPSRLPHRHSPATLTVLRPSDPADDTDDDIQGSRLEAAPCGLRLYLERLRDPGQAERLVNRELAADLGGACDRTQPSGVEVYVLPAAVNAPGEQGTACGSIDCASEGPRSPKVLSRCAIATIS
jgi:hypothetical protein